MTLRVENDDDVFYKTDDMEFEIHYGKVYIIQATGNECEYELKKINTKTGEYEHSNDNIKFNICGEELYPVDGYFTVHSKDDGEEEPTQLDKIEANLDFIVMINT